ncbi:aspartic peptidase domain-containing protein [Infundibulicybe gibba]|nr:aspartic peptidase domain-containing protein [Infundibulicybe gibba]
MTPLRSYFQFLSCFQILGATAGLKSGYSGSLALHKSFKRVNGLTGKIGLGDYIDYLQCPVTVGNTSMPVVLDTGSSDFWVLSDACKRATDLPLYPQQALKPAGLDVELSYGDSRTGTRASGLIGTDQVELAGLSFSGQYFAAINDTNTSVLDTGSTGIFGLGFPLNSVIWNRVFYNTHGSNASNRVAIQYGRDFRRGSFPAIHKLFLFSGNLASPMFSIALQRDTIDIGGNAGILSIGELPVGVENEAITWAPVRGYTPIQGGLLPPPDSPKEVYPIVWEIFIDDVFFDGELLPRLPNTSLSALVDTGSSLIRGPAKAIDIGGKLFPVDPRDFVSQVYKDSVATCIANLAPADPPAKEGTGYLYSWSLGDPFLKSVLSAFYYGNLSYPSRDPPRIGFLSTVPPDAADRLRISAEEGSRNGGNFPAMSEPAPSGTPAVSNINPEGVPQAMATNIMKPTPGTKTNDTYQMDIAWALFIMWLSITVLLS